MLTVGHFIDKIMANTLTLAIDPGASGGYAYKLSDSATVVVSTLPDNDADILRDLSELKAQADSAELTIENVASHVGGSPMMAAGMSKLFGHKRFIEGVAMALGYRIVNVTPQAWQKHFSLGKRKDYATQTAWKNKLKSEAQKRFPSIKVTLATADALLILEHALSK